MERADTGAEAGYVRPGGTALATLSGRLHPSDGTTVLVRVPKPDRPAVFESEAHYLQAGVEEVEVPARWYECEPYGTTIAVPESYAAVLDRTRAYRATEAPADAGEAAAGTDKLAGAALAHLALPEDVLHALDCLPEAELVRQVVLLETTDPDDLWRRQQLGDPRFQAAAATDRIGTVTLFGATASPWLRFDLGHELAHLVRGRRRHEAALFDAAATLEAGGYAQRPYANESPEENWAVHLGEEFLLADDAAFRLLAGHAPLRTAGLAFTVKRLSPPLDAAAAERQRARVEWVERQTWPVASRQLTALVRRGPADRHYDAASLLLLHLGTAADVDGVSELTVIRWGFQPVGDASLARLIPLRDRLRELDLAGTWFTRRGVGALYGLGELRELWLAHTAFDDACTWVLPSLTHLELLDLAYTGITDAAVTALGELSRLLIVDLRGTRVTAAGVNRLRQLHPNGAALDISHDSPG